MWEMFLLAFIPVSKHFYVNQNYILFLFKII